MSRFSVSRLPLSRLRIPPPLLVVRTCSPSLMFYRSRLCLRRRLSIGRQIQKAAFSLTASLVWTWFWRAWTTRLVRVRLRLAFLLAPPAAKKGLKTRRTALPLTL